jgi:hypothetical protein
MGGGIMNTNICTRSLFFAPKLWEPHSPLSGFVRIDPPAPFDISYATGLNNKGEVVGTFENATTSVPYIFNAYTDTLTIISEIQTNHNEQIAVNDRGWVVGTFQSRGFLYVDGVTYVLSDLVRGTGWSITSAVDINNSGQILAFGITPGIAGAVVLTPVPTPPVIKITATPDTLWPPNGRLVPVTVSGTITDAGSGVAPSTATFEVKDEYGLIQPRGQITTLDMTGNYTFTIQLQASRKGNDKDGRQYTITVSAEDDAGNTGSATAIVTVPYDQGSGGTWRLFR